MPKCEGSAPKMSQDIRVHSDIIITFWTCLDFNQVVSEEEIAAKRL